MIRVLIVEDDPMVAELNRGYINRMDGFKVVGIKADGKEALEYISKKQVDLLVLDVNVQKINGLEVLIQIRKSQEDIDVIFITASREKGVVGKALKLGVIDYLIKPYTFERLQEALEKYKNQYLLLNSNAEIGQAEIDKLFKRTVSVEVPKGIHRKTLDKINKYLSTASREIRVKEMSTALKISEVTVRHYLDYLTEKGYLYKDLEYGSMGRPTILYVMREH